jgi:hypothetical protein
MTNTDERQDRLIRLLSPEFRIAEEVSQPNGPVAEDLLRRIMGESVPDSRSVLSRRHRSWRLRLAFAVPVMAGLVALAFVVSAWLPESSPVGPAPAQAAVLQFTSSSGYLDIKILDPAADPQRYEKELAEHGLNIDLALAPATADRVGRVIFQEVDDGDGPALKTIEAPGRCAVNGNCSVGIRVPLSYKGHARIMFGRTPKPGETVEGDAPVLSPLQERQLRALVGKHVSDARTQLAAHGQTATYRVGFRSLEASADQVPGSWYVYDVAPLANSVVVLWVSADGKEPTR